MKSKSLFVLFFVTFVADLSFAQQSGILFYRREDSAIGVLTHCTSVPRSIPPAVGSNVRANAETANPQNETSVAVNPRNPANIIVGLNDFVDGDSSPGYRVSFDSGKTWQGGILNFVGLPRSWTAGGDPAVAFDKLGNAYYVCIAFNRSGGAAVDVSILIFRSTEGGLNWQFRSVIEDGFGSAPLQDKPYLAIDTISTDSRANRIYVAWTEINPVGTHRILLEYSSDSGSTFQRSSTDPLTRFQVRPLHHSVLCREWIAWVGHTLLGRKVVRFLFANPMMEA